MDRQEAFEKATKGILRQGAPAVSAGGLGCSYRTKEGLKCAIGQLLPENTPQEVWDAQCSVPTFFAQYPDVARQFGDMIFYIDLQGVHDGVFQFYKHDEEKWLHAFIAESIRFAAVYDLDINFLKEKSNA